MRTFCRTRRLLFCPAVVTCGTRHVVHILCFDTVCSLLLAEYTFLRVFKQLYMLKTFDIDITCCIVGVWKPAEANLRNLCNLFVSRTLSWLCIRRCRLTRRGFDRHASRQTHYFFPHAQSLVTRAGFPDTTCSSLYFVQQFANRASIFVVIWNRSLTAPIRFVRGVCPFC